VDDGRDGGGRKQEDEEMGHEFGNDLFTAVELFSSQGKLFSSGLGNGVDELLGGGMLVGEVLEIYGPAGAGKTQLALAMAAQVCAAKSPVVFISAKDKPLDLALRFSDMLAGRCHQSAEFEQALDRAHFTAAGDFSELARILRTIAPAFPPNIGGGGVCSGLLVVDGAAALLAPFMAASGNHRWRLPWLWRILRRLAIDLGISVVILSHVVGTAYGATSNTQPALGPLWAGAAATRLELSRIGATMHGNYDAAKLKLTLRKSPRAADGATALLLLTGAGVFSEACE